jgi:DNA helicase-2/ATP-dependent DNA helicase PcrA
MVDEFQDTNMAQMRILHNLTDNEIHGGRPNIMVVGDDDQAIYSFQGADVGNISSFRDIFPQTALITLTDNYRSSDIILTSARSVITRGTDRLENHITALDKTLTAHRPSTNSTVELVELPTAGDERAWLASTIANNIQAGTPPETIAVLARRHHELVALLPYLAKKGIAVNYERRDNVLDLDIIQLIEHIAEIAVALYEQRHQDADSLLPWLLASPAFAVEPQEIWRLSLRARANHQMWLEIMATTPELQPLQEWLIGLSQKLPHTPLEQMLDEIIGRTKNEQAFTSPIYDHYFSQKTLTETPDTYLIYLEALRTIRTKLREYQPEETPSLQSFLEFLRLHRQLGSTITSVRPRTDRLAGAITLMTAHKSKGLEFDSVYVTGAIDSAWGERVRSRTRLIGYPENLPLAPSGDTFDERLRLFFVAMTRARAHLTISYSLAGDSQKSTMPASFLTGENWQPNQPQLPNTIQDLVEDAQAAWYQPIVSPIAGDMRALLATTLEHYKLSSTHLTTFLDVARGGPQTFLMNNLLRFPQATSPSAGFGSAIHATLQRAHAHLSATGHQRPIEDILHDFEENLRSQNLGQKDFDAYLQKGSDALPVFLEDKYSTFTRSQKTELNFAGQAVFLGKAHLTGSLDLVDIQDGRITVTDYKTGKALRSWQGKTDYEKVKLHKYKQQLMFYHLLVANSRDYHQYPVEKGVLQFVEPTLQNEILALEDRFSHDDLQQFAQLIQKVWQRIITLDLPDISDYEPSYKGILAFEAALLDE